MYTPTYLKSFPQYFSYKNKQYFTYKIKIKKDNIFLSNKKIKNNFSYRHGKNRFQNPCLKSSPFMYYTYFSYKNKKKTTFFLQNRKMFVFQIQKIKKKFIHGTKKRNRF